MGRPLSQRSKRAYAKRKAAAEGRLWLSREEFMAARRAERKPAILPSDAEIAAFIAQHGVTRLPAGAARGALNASQRRLKPGQNTRRSNLPVDKRRLPKPGRK